ncbi:MAG: hypothetical protein V4459_04015 [Pseudomonadota bacterium]
MSGVRGETFLGGNLSGPNRRADRASIRTFRLTDPATGSDRRRFTEARAAARTAIREADREDSGVRRAAFRQEMGTNVRSASPFLLSLASAAGEDMDRLLDRLDLAERWPRFPALSSRPAMRFRRLREPPQRFVIATPTGDREVVRRRGFGHTVPFIYSGGDWACLEVVEHSLEVEARLGPARLETLFGVLRIELDAPLPETIAAAIIGRPVGDVVDHASLRGHPWPIAAVEEAPSPTSGQTLVVETGSVAFRMPWMR